MALPDIRIRKATLKDKPYKLFDGGGLYVLINSTGTKLWRFKYRYLGKERLFSIGAYPVIGVAEARQIRDNLKNMLSRGIDPNQQRRVSLHQKIEAAENTFEAVARRWLSIKKIGEKHKVCSLRRVEIHAFPRLGFRPINEIKTIELASCLEAVERKGVLETAHRVKQIIQQVFRYAVRKGLIDHNPAGDLRDIISHAPVQNRACIHPSELPQLLTSINNYVGSPLTLAAIKLLALTFVRTGELIGAKWSEIDFGRAEWCIPAERMKMRRDHLVPLSNQALATFEGLKPFTGRREFIFHTASNKSGFISNNAVLSALKRMGYKGRMTGHGFRALASTILNEQRKHHSDIIERQLAHADRNEIRGIYNRAEYLLERKRMMQDWADYLDDCLVETQKVVVGNFSRRIN